MVWMIVVVAVDMIYHYLINVLVHNEQEILYHMKSDLKKQIKKKILIFKKKTKEKNIHQI